MLLLITSLKLIVEIAIFALLGRWLVGVLAGPKRTSNVFYRLLDVMVRPFEKLVRLVTPRVVIDRHIPLATLSLLVGIWLVTTLAKINLCVQMGVQTCQ